MKILTKISLVFFFLVATYSAFAQGSKYHFSDVFPNTPKDLVQIFDPSSADSSNDTLVNLIHTYHRQGFLAAQSGDLKNALSIYQKAWALLFSTELNQEKATLQMHLGVLKARMKNYAQADGHFQKALRFYKQAGNPNGQAHIYNAQAALYLAQEKKDEARTAVRKALSWGRSIGDLQALAGSYRALAELYRQEKNGKAQQYIQLSQEIQAKVDSSNFQRYQLDSAEAAKLWEETALIHQELSAQSREQVQPSRTLPKEDVKEVEQLIDTFNFNTTLMLILGFTTLILSILSLYLGYYFNIQKDKIKDLEEALVAKDEAFEDQKEDLENVQYVLVKKDQTLKENLLYAQRVQQAAGAPVSIFEKVFPEHFVFFKPKDLAGGDFYWYRAIDNKVYVAVGDCTGHGVKGSFLALLTQNFLNEIICEKDLREPYRVVEHLHMKMNQILQPDDPYEADQIHITLCRIERTSDKDYNITFSGSRQNLLYYRHQDQTLYELKGDRKGVGDYVSVRNLLFTQENVLLNENDAIYLYTNGFADAHNQRKERFGNKQFKEFINQHAMENFENQSKALENTLEDFTGGTTLMDDVTIMGLKLGETTKDSVLNNTEAPPSSSMGIVNLNKEFNFFDYYAQISQGKIVLSYKGPLTDILLSEFSRDIRSKIQDRPKIGKKVFAIFMELAQNVLFYSKEINHFGNRDRVGTLVILQGADHYKIITGNLVYKSATALLQEKCEMVNSLDREALREYKRQLRNAPKGKESRGAGIGIVQVALTSSNPIEYEIKELSNNFAFYVISVRVEK